MSISIVVQQSPSIKEDPANEPDNSPNPSTEPGATNEAARTARYESIQKCVATIVHVCQCNDTECRRVSCDKIKRVVQHTIACQKRIKGTCTVCRQLIALCCFHAKQCTTGNRCTVPYCKEARQKLASKLQKAEGVQEGPIIKEEPADESDNLPQPSAELEAGNGASATARYESIQKFITSMVHACQCSDTNCSRVSCYKLKRVVRHGRICKKRIDGTCEVCKMLIPLCCYHAKQCSRDGCTVPYCMNVRGKLAEKKRAEQRREAMMLRRTEA